MGGFVVRDGNEADVDALLDIERRAARLLLDRGGLDLFAMHGLSRDDLDAGIREGILHVVETGGARAGFALAGEVDGNAHLFEIDVLPEHGRHGIGSALLESVCAEATRRGYPAITLTTLRDVPWNAPFYARRGFAEFDEAAWGDQLRGIVGRERLLGFPAGLRVAMRRLL
ncbi:GNAT family N-acetyltransferase [Pseudoxanthomonas sangjuensis]|uniref:GNAT family N-acetyltransferase n=1 Tax=Pseudoxanthomonas sangjuensis TaxID=1503750 RepID=UPI001390D0FE|nr:GNAT family N-acetyltransferase [Pseudoxanthomonas sangjuensis]KAF1714149.1 GNAT family N-acetyltransferase [Pseudoxanthomonas sangjuensis]